MTRTAQSTGSLMRVVKNHLTKENEMTATTSIPLSKLVLWSGNVRKTAGSDTGLAELAASIAAHGLINPLTVRPGKGDMFEVGAGGRRFAALQLLLKQKQIPSDYPVRCEVRSKDDNFLE